MRKFTLISVLIIIFALFFGMNVLTGTTPTKYEPLVGTLKPVEVSPYEVQVKPTIEPTIEPTKVAPTATPIKNLTSPGAWVHDSNVSWYGPGFYGHRTACGLAYTTKIIGVAHRTLPCGTLVEFKYKGKSIIVPVIDRGPYVSGRIWDLSGGLCVFLDHCFTGSIDYRVLK